jgi:ligand-binding SRPBCC domain-containing protein
MKILKFVLKIIFGLVALCLIAALFISKDFNYQKSILIDAPVEKVWEHTNSLEGLESWSPWNDYDPNMKKEFHGQDGTIGAHISWESDHQNVGVGTQTIAKIVPPSYFETELVFMLPYESRAVGSVKLNKEGNQTNVTWSFSSKIPYPFNLTMKLIDMEGALGKDFKLGLEKLKDLCEQ